MEINYVTYYKQLRPMLAELDYNKGHMTIIYGDNTANYVAEQLSKVIEILYDLNIIIKTFTDNQGAQKFYIDHYDDMMTTNTHLIIISDKMNIDSRTSIFSMAENVLTAVKTPERFTVKVTKNRATGQVLAYMESLK